MHCYEVPNIPLLSPLSAKTQGNCPSSINGEHLCPHRLSLAITAPNSTGKGSTRFLLETVNSLKTVIFYQVGALACALACPEADGQS